MVAGWQGRAADAVRAEKEPAAARGQVRGPVAGQVGSWSPKGSRCTVATRFLGQTTWASVFQILWVLDPFTRYRPSPGKCANCTHLGVFHAILKFESRRTHTTLGGFPGQCPNSWVRNAGSYLVTPPAAQSCPHKSLPRGNISPKMEPAGLCRGKAAMNLAAAA